MEKLDCQECLVHTLICTNERPEGKASCKPVGGQDLYDRLKKKLKETGFYRTHWLTRTGCLGFCNTVGTTVTIHRKDQKSIWYSQVVLSDFDSVWEAITKEDEQ